MSDFSGIAISDLAGLSQPLTKLIETVSCGIGKIYEPIHIMRIAQAKSKEIEIISNAIMNNIELPTSYKDGDISIDSKNINDLIARTKDRLIYQELKKQQNIESVFAIAYECLKDIPCVDNTPVDSDWTNEFFDNVANINSHSMQVLWGKLLAGEVECPGTYSLRTLKTLKLLSQREAQLFTDILPFVLRCKGSSDGSTMDYFLPTGTYSDVLTKHNITFSKITLLSDAGLVSNTPFVCITLNIDPGCFEKIESYSKIISIKNNEDHAITLSYLVYCLTEAGKQLLNIARPPSIKLDYDKYLKDCAEDIRLNAVLKPIVQKTTALTFDII